jgi:CheY-like chemotaxis protein
MQPLKVLVLDDESIVRWQLKQALCKHATDVEIFESPDQQCTTNGTEFDVVVSDIRMKGIDGLKVLDVVRSKPKRKKVIMQMPLKRLKGSLSQRSFAVGHLSHDPRLALNKAAKAWPSGIGSLEQLSHSTELISSQHSSAEISHPPASPPPIPNY